VHGAGIPVGNTPGVLTDTTADFAFALLMAAARRVPRGGRLRQGGQVEDLGPEAAAGRRRLRRDLGHRGVGRIGQAMARRARGFDMRVLAYDPYLDPDSPQADPDLVTVVDLETLLAESDFVSIHVPLTERRIT
jgi:glyoxylate reductase